MRMIITSRDEQVLEALSTFTFLDTSHVKSLLFSDVHKESMYRSIRRLRRHRLIRQVGVRSSALDIKGGTPPGVYALSHKGFYFIKHPGKYKGGEDWRHALLVADINVGLIEREREGLIKLLDDSRLEYSTGSMRADLYLHIGIVATRVRRKFLVEVQRNARTDVIGPKIEAHWQAFQTYVGEGKYPRVAFVVKDEGHLIQIRRQIPPQRKELFDVYLIEEFLAAACAAQ